MATGNGGREKGHYVNTPYLKQTEEVVQERDKEVELHRAHP